MSDKKDYNIPPLKGTIAYELPSYVPGKEVDLPPRNPVGVIPLPPVGPKGRSIVSELTKQGTFQPTRIKEPRTFSGADITCIVHVLGNAGKEPYVIANAQTLSYSVHREKVPVRALGHTYPMGYTRSGRMIAGSIIFTMLDREVLWELVQAYAVDVDWTDEDQKYTTYSPMLDQLPPFDITIVFSNEYGDISVMAIYGVELVDEGTVLSIDDLIVEKTCSWVARDIDMMRPYDYGGSAKIVGGPNNISMEVVSNNDMVEYIDTLRSRRNRFSTDSTTNTDDAYFYDIPYDAAIFNSSASQSKKYPTLTNGQGVTYYKDGVGWHGTVYVKYYGSGVEEYVFTVDSTSDVGYKKLGSSQVPEGMGSNVFVHSTALDENGNIPSTVDNKYMIPYSNTVLRNELVEGYK